MRNLSAALLVLLLCSLHLACSAPAIHSPDCCTELIDIKIPLKKVKSYTRTSSACPLKAIVINTVAGRSFCVDPAAAWVSSHVAAVDKQKQ